MHFNQFFTLLSRCGDKRNITMDCPGSRRKELQDNMFLYWRQRGPEDRQTPPPPLTSAEVRGGGSWGRATVLTARVKGRAIADSGGNRCCGRPWGQNQTEPVGKDKRQTVSLPSCQQPASTWWDLSQVESIYIYVEYAGVKNTIAYTGHRVQSSEYVV